MNKTAQILIRLTSREKKRISAMAEAVGYSRSEFLLTAALCNIPPMDQTELDQLKKKLDRYGRELNQLMRWLWSHVCILSDPAEEILEIWSEVRLALDETFNWVDVDPPSRLPPERTGRKEEVLHLRISTEERQRLRARAARNQKSVSKYIRRAALKRPPRLRRLSAEQTYVSLMRIGNNLTQAIRYFDELGSPTDYGFLEEELQMEAARFRRAFGWDIQIGLEDERDGLCESVAGGEPTTSVFFD